MIGVVKDRYINDGMARRYFQLMIKGNTGVTQHQYSTSAMRRIRSVWEATPVKAYVPEVKDRLAKAHKADQPLRDVPYNL